MWFLLMTYSILRYVILMCVKLLLREKLLQTKVVFLGLPDLIHSHLANYT